MPFSPLGSRQGRRRHFGRLGWQIVVGPVSVAAALAACGSAGSSQNDGTGADGGSFVNEGGTIGRFVSSGGDDASSAGVVASALQFVPMATTLTVDGTTPQTRLRRFSFQATVNGQVAERRRPCRCSSIIGLDLATAISPHRLAGLGHSLGRLRRRRDASRALRRPRGHGQAHDRGRSARSRHGSEHGRDRARQRGYDAVGRGRHDDCVPVRQDRVPARPHGAHRDVDRADRRHARERRLSPAPLRGRAGHHRTIGIQATTAPSGDQEIPTRRPRNGPFRKRCGIAVTASNAVVLPTRFTSSCPVTTRGP